MDAHHPMSLVTHTFGIGRAFPASAVGQARRFAADLKASTLTTFTLMLPVLAAALGGVIDYSLAASLRAKMQTTADSAAVAAAAELGLTRANSTSVASVAVNFVNSVLPGATTSVNVDTRARTVQVAIDKQYPPITRVFLSAGTVSLSVSATATLNGSLPLCLLGLDPSAPETIGLEANALMTAPGCLVQSNSTSKLGMKSQNSAVLRAGMICSAGGKVNATSANFSPQPTTDCPVLPDPLAARTTPSTGSCNSRAKIIDGINVTLQPGTYCGGLTITHGASVRLAPGVFIISGGPLIVDGGSSFSGTDVGIYLQGAASNLTFDADSTISLVAPTSGPLAGILIFDDPSGAPAPAIASKSGRGALGKALKNGSTRQHQILSDNARTLLGTIYMPKGEIIIDALRPIADKSAYTVLVVQQLHLYSGPNLILNSDYTATNVPVPMGVGPSSAKIFVSK